MMITWLHFHLKTILEASEDLKVVAIGNSGEEAIKLYDEFDPDVLLMDIRMSGMTGIEAGEKILEKHSDAKNTVSNYIFR